MRISLILAGRTIPGFNTLADGLARTFRSPVSTEFIDFPFTRSFRKQRGQYDAGVLLDELARTAEPDCVTLFIVREDLFHAPLNFVFGMAKKGCAVVSTARLDPRFYGPAGDLQQARALFVLRIGKEALHEAGHALGLPHCKDKSCVMAFSDSIEGVDLKKQDFCAGCRKALYLEG